MTDMAPSLSDKLVVAISSRALFDFEEENRVFEHGDDRAYVELQRQRLDIPAPPGVAFSLVRKLLAFNHAEHQRVEVVLLSRNDPVSGMRVFRSCQAHGLPSVQRGVFTQGRDPFRYLRPLGAHLFLSANETDVRSALHLGFPAARVLTESVQAGDAHPREVRIAFDGDAVLFSDEAERVYQSEGLAAFQRHESAKAAQPLPEGPFKPLLAALHRLAGRRRGHAHTHGPGHRPQRAGARARHTHADGLEHRRGRGDVSGRPTQGGVFARVRTRLLLRRPDRPCELGRAPCAGRACEQRDCECTGRDCQVVSSR